MKTSELHRLIQKQGWVALRQTGSHIIYEKNGVKVAVPYHGSKEMATGMVKKFFKEMGLK